MRKIGLEETRDSEDAGFIKKGRLEGLPHISA
jgi:hypothetical protein